jgi:hypothetical protein
MLGRPAEMQLECPIPELEAAYARWCELEALRDASGGEAS